MSTLRTMYTTVDEHTCLLQGAPAKVPITHNPSTSRNFSISQFVVQSFGFWILKAVCSNFDLNFWVTVNDKMLSISHFYRRCGFYCPMMSYIKGNGPCRNFCYLPCGLLVFTMSIYYVLYHVVHSYTLQYTSV